MPDTETTNNVSAVEERLQKTETALKDAIELSYGEFQVLLTETARQQKEVNDSQNERIGKLEVAMAAPTPAFVKTIGGIIPTERLPAFFEGQQVVAERLRVVKSTKDAQHVLYAAADATARLLDTRGPVLKMVHVEKRQLVLGGIGLTAVGVGIGFGAATVAANRTLRKSGKSRDELKAWLASDTSEEAAPAAE